MTTPAEEAFLEHWDYTDQKDLMREELTALLLAQQQTLLEWINAEVIGKDTNLSVVSRGEELDNKFFNSPYAVTKQTENNLRAEQRKALQRIKDELGEGEK